jgi:hypothetical protein
MATAAVVTSTNSEPFGDFTGGKTLKLTIDGGSEQTISFVNGDFVNPAAATAEEIVTKINASLTGATASGTVTVAITTTSLGFNATIVIGAGTANSIIGFTTGQTATGTGGLLATLLTCTVITEDSVTRQDSTIPSSPGGPRSRGVALGTRPCKTFHCTVLIPTSEVYQTGGVPISGLTSQALATRGQLVNANALANPGLGCPVHIEDVVVLSNGNAAGLDDAFIVSFDRGVSGTRPHKFRINVNDAGGANARFAEHSNAVLAEALTVYCRVKGY